MRLMACRPSARLPTSVRSRASPRPKARVDGLAAGRSASATWLERWSAMPLVARPTTLNVGPGDRPARLRREERLEEVRQRVRRHTGAAVAYLERGGTVPVGDRDREHAWPGRLGGHGVERVLEQVDQHLAELLTVGARRDAVRQLELERHAARLEAGAERLQRRPGQLGQSDRPEPALLSPREAAQPG